ncbi:hypothetical protein Taro_047415 [Colocasia esculenta]|uniref:Uncharacterized protein n=1 Tax=Colocasia esculenta TaxID=4460 RepID=A0A843X6N1_COLES|nr:hypothetical protein [Colocasia esculenta]
MLSVLQMQIQQLDVRFDFMSKEVHQMKDLLLQLVCQMDTTISQDPPTQTEDQQQQFEAADVHPKGSLVQLEKDPAVELEQQPPVPEVQSFEQKLEKSDQETDPHVQTFKRRVRRKLMKSGQLVFPSQSSSIPSPSTAQDPPLACDPIPPLVAELPPPPPTQPTPSISTTTSISTPQPPIDPPINAPISSFPLKYHFKTFEVVTYLQTDFTTMRTFNEERFKLGLLDLNKGQWRMILQGNIPITPSMTIGLPSGLHPSLVGAISSRKQFANLVLNMHIRIAGRFKVKYNIKLSFHRFAVMNAPKSSQHMREFQHCFVESERLNEEEWVAAYPELSAECRKHKLSPIVFLLKGYDNLRKSSYDKWIQRYTPNSGKLKYGSTPTSEKSMSDRTLTFEGLKSDSTLTLEKSKSGSTPTPGKSKSLFRFEPYSNSWKDNEQEEVDPNTIEREVESDEEEESWHDEDKFEEDDKDDRYGTWRTESDSFYLCRPRVHIPVHDIDCLPVHSSRLGDRDHLPVDHASSATFPFFLTTRGKIDPGSTSRYITTLVHAHIPGPVDAWREFPVPV